ncbi:MAG: hypothetical protein IBX55_01540 [Methyloprofundus sp.]|nr:hypothetical protein [Methyloprofundus sp.]
MLQNKKIIFLSSLIMALVSGSVLSSDNSVLKSIDEFESERIANTQNLILLEQRLKILQLSSQLDDFKKEEDDSIFHHKPYDVQTHESIINQPAIAKENIPEQFRQDVERSERIEREAEFKRQQTKLEEKNRIEDLKSQKRRELDGFKLRGVYKSEGVSIARIGQGSRTLEIKIGESLPGGWVVKKISESYLEVSNRMLPGESLTVSGG